MATTLPTRPLVAGEAAHLTLQCSCRLPWSSRVGVQTTGGGSEVVVAQSLANLLGVVLNAQETYQVNRLGSNQAAIGPTAGTGGAFNHSSKARRKCSMLASSGEPLRI
jgi:hypothetical protein